MCVCVILCAVEHYMADNITTAPFVSLLSHLLASPADVEKRVDALELNDEEKDKENHTLEGHGHQVGAHSRFIHREVVQLIGDVCIKS